MTQIKLFKAPVVRETAYGIVDDYGEQENKLTLVHEKSYYRIEWEVGKDGEVDYTEMGVVIEGNKVIDIDGVFEAPKEALQLLRDNGFDTSEVE